jgi:hypothetical protein
MENKMSNDLVRGWFTPTDGFYGIGEWGWHRENDKWNGWEMPYFDRLTCDRIIRDLNNLCENTGDPARFKIDWQEIERIFTDGDPMDAIWLELCDGEWIGHNLYTRTIDNVRHYALGAQVLTWSKHHVEHRDDLARLGPLGAGEWVEIAFEALNGWHASIPTDDEMQLMLSGTLDDIVALAEFVEKHSPYLGDSLPYWDEARDYASRCDWFYEEQERYPRLDWDRIEPAWSANFDRLETGRDMA